MQNETIGLQVVVEAGAAPLDGVTVELRRPRWPRRRGLEQVALARESSRARSSAVPSRPSSNTSSTCTECREGARRESRSGGSAGPARRCGLGGAGAGRAYSRRGRAGVGALSASRRAACSNGIVWIDVNVSERASGRASTGGTIDVRTPTESGSRRFRSPSISSTLRLPDPDGRSILFSRPRRASNGASWPGAEGRTRGRCSTRIGSRRCTTPSRRPTWTARDTRSTARSTRPAHAGSRAGAAAGGRHICSSARTAPWGCDLREPHAGRNHRRRGRRARFARTDRDPPLRGRRGLRQPPRGRMALAPQRLGRRQHAAHSRRMDLLRETAGGRPST